MKQLLAFLFISILASAANATIFLSSDGDSTGVQSYSYVFTNNYSGVLYIGVANELDDEVDPVLELSDFGGLLSGTLNVTLGDVGTDMSSFANVFGEQGTTGELLAFNITAEIGDSISFLWNMIADDGAPYNDFSFVALPSLEYHEVLAQIHDVPEPSAFALFGCALIGFGMARRKRV